MSEETTEPTTAPEITPPEEPALTAAQMAAVNKAVNARLTREAAKLQKTLDERLANIAVRDDSAVSAPKGETETIVAQHAKTLEKLQALEAERATERQAKAEAEEKSTLQDALIKAGVSNVKGALALLRAEGKIVRDDDGNPAYEGELSTVSLADGLKEWLSGEDGMHYLPPKDVSGSGASGAKSPRKLAPQTKEERIKEADAFLASAYSRKRI